MKRKVSTHDPDGSQTVAPFAKKRNTSGAAGSSPIEAQFRTGLFSPSVLSEYKSAYISSTPYPHAVIPSLISVPLLTSVRNEITTHISFTLKETDIYRIHQSGDLANLSNLDAASLSHLPSLLQLRDALYSPQFRAYLSNITGAGKLSGTKTDMAVNVYTPGSYLLCHDDVIGSRRVSYILYLTDPNPKRAWKAEWGGGLRLHPTEKRINEAGEEVRVPLPEHTVNIPPSFGQLSFFAVRPGESFHDVEEVYHATADSKDKDDVRVRMAISGWYHIPQEGEDGYQEGLEESLAQKSSLAQLEGKGDVFDEPKVDFKPYANLMAANGDSNGNVKRKDSKKAQVEDEDEDILTETDLTFLLNYIAPSYLTPDMTDNLSSSFGDNSFLQLDRFFSDKFVKRVQDYVESCEANEMPPIRGIAPTDPKEKDGEFWRTARPPHKHRFLFLLPVAHRSTNLDGEYPLHSVLNSLLQSHAFKKWLGLITGLDAKCLLRQNVLARRFRRGKDYALASTYRGEEPMLEFTIGITPTRGWEDEEDPEETGEEISQAIRLDGTNEHGKLDVDAGEERIDVGGEEVYMAGEDEDEVSSVPSNPLPRTGKADPAIYKTADDDEDDGILFTNPACWNRFSIVLRDKGTLRFVKYVSQAARGDRWDIKGEVELAANAFDDASGCDNELEEEQAEVSTDGEQGSDELDEEDDEDEEDDNDDDDGITNE